MWSEILPLHIYCTCANWTDVNRPGRSYFAGEKERLVKKRRQSDQTQIQNLHFTDAKFFDMIVEREVFSVFCFCYASYLVIHMQFQDSEQ